MIIDFHTHTFPDKIAAAAIDKLQHASHSKAFTNGTVSGLQASMQRAGIDRSVVLPVATNPLKVSAMNDISCELTNQKGLVYFGCIHPNMEGAEAELTRIAGKGLKGIKIHPVYQDGDIEDLQLLKAEEFCQLVRAFGSDRVVFGTDSPWDDQAAALAAIRALDLTEEEKEKILGGNAQRILKI